MRTGGNQFAQKKNVWSNIESVLVLNIVDFGLLCHGVCRVVSSF